VFVDSDAYQPTYHCPKCGGESSTKFVLGLMGFGNVCYSCWQRGNKDDGKLKRAKLIKKAVAERTARREIEGMGLARFA